MALGPEGANGKQTNGQVMRELDEGLCTEGKKKRIWKGVEKGAAILAPGCTTFGEKNIPSSEYIMIWKSFIHVSFKIHTYFPIQFP